MSGLAYDTTERHMKPVPQIARTPKIRGPLTAKQRNALPTSTFALPGRRYPIPDVRHARNALARVSQHGSPAEQAAVKRAVKRKFPGIDVS